MWRGHQAGPHSSAPRWRRLRPAVAIAGVGLLLLAGANPLRAQRGFAFSMDFGYSGVSGGDWSNVLDHGIHSEIMIDYLLPSGVIIGAGMYFVSFDLDSAFGDATISNVQPQAMLGYVFSRGKVRPYVQLRGVVVRLRVEGYRAPTADGENSAPQRWGSGGVGAGGIEFVPWRYVSFDLSGWYGMFSTQEVDLTDIGGPVIASGQSYGVQLGLKWYPAP